LPFNGLEYSALTGKDYYPVARVLFYYSIANIGTLTRYI